MQEYVFRYVFSTNLFCVFPISFEQECAVIFQHSNSQPVFMTSVVGEFAEHCTFCTWEFGVARNV